jgi:hypothetical protein
VFGVGYCGTGCPGSASYYLAGQFNGWNAAGNEMMETSSGSGIWSLSLTGLEPGQRQEFKVTNGSWDWNYPGANIGSMPMLQEASRLRSTLILCRTVAARTVPPGLNAPINWTIAGSFNVWNNAVPKGR